MLEVVIGSLRSLKSVKPNWMEDVEGVNNLTLLRLPLP